MGAARCRRGIGILARRTRRRHGTRHGHRPRSAQRPRSCPSVRQGGHNAGWWRARPRLDFQPDDAFSAAGTRPDPAVSVPSAKGTMPCATATAEPLDDPPGTIAGVAARCAARHRASARRQGRWRTGRGWSCRWGSRRPPRSRATDEGVPGPACLRRRPDTASGGGHAGHVDVVPFTAKGSPQSGKGGVETARSARAARIRVGLRGEMEKRSPDRRPRTGAPAPRPSPSAGSSPST